MAIQNPDFVPPPGGIAAERTRMIDAPTGLERPLVILGGWRTPAFTAKLLERDLRILTGADRSRTRAVGVLFANTMDHGIRRIVDAVQRAWPSDDRRATTKVDVVGISMGGLLARAAALPDQSGGRRQLAIGRLFTLGTPHRGASLAKRIAIDATARDMRAGSGFLGMLDEALEHSSYELVCYGRTHDMMVGATNTAPPGYEPFWRPGPLLFSHVTLWSDPLIRLDIARRLRREEPLARRSSMPPCD